jgi:hypothetical protein
MKKEPNIFNDFTYIDDDLKLINFEPTRWPIKEVPIIKDRRIITFKKLESSSWTYYNCIWIINLLYNIFYIVKHCQNDLPLFEIMITNIENARFLPQIKAFLQEIYVDDIPIKPSPPVKFNKCL